MRAVVLALALVLTASTALADGSGSAAGSAAEPTPAAAAVDEPDAAGSGSAAGSAAEPAPAAAAAPPAAAPDAGGLLKDAYRAATTKQWALLAGFILMGLVWIARIGAIKVIPWFSTTSGGVALAFGISACGTLGLALSSGAAVTVDLFVSAATTAATAAGLWQWVSKRFPGASAKIDAAKEAKRAASA